jgi:hypothetical protein
MAGRPIDPFRIKPLSPYSTQASCLSAPPIAPPLDQREPGDAIAAIATQPRSVPPPPPPSPIPPPRAKRQGWGSRLLWQTGPFPLAWVLFVLGFSGVGVGGFVWLTALPPLPDCRQATPLTTESERLFCADQAARGGKEPDVRAALQLVQGWGLEHPLRNQSQALVQTWSKTLLLLARQKVDHQDLDGAIALARQIPSTIPDYKEVKSAIADWIDIRDQGQRINATIQAALKIANWSEAQAKLLDLAKLDDKYSRQNVTRLRQQINQEQTAARQLDALRRQVKLFPTRVETLGQSIALAETIDASTYVFAKAEKEIQGWSKTLLGMLSSRLEKSDWVGANAVAQQLPLHRTYRPEDRHALWLARASVLATGNASNAPLGWQLWTLWTTIPPLQEVAATQGLANDAKALLPRLTMQSQDLIQLQLAKTLAQVRLDPALRLAAGLLTAVTPQRPQRIAAQTLLAQWHKEIELAEDYPLLLEARAIAQDGSKPKLQMAIAQARLVTPKRARRPEAQTLIAQWIGQIQVIEDRPIIQQAKAIASRGNLGEAIRVAAKIRVGRSLYPEAQTAIGDWVAQIQVAEDQAIVDRAQGLAAAGNLSAAIDVASQIAPDRPLYRQVQGDLSSWVRERDAIWRERQRDTPATTGRDSTDVGISGTFTGGASEAAEPVELPLAEGTSSN